MIAANTAATPDINRRDTQGVPVSLLAGILLALFALDNLLLLQFLGLSPILAVILIACLCPVVALLAEKSVATKLRVPWPALAIAALIAVSLFALGGQGRFFYANPDWQIRDAILADMARYPWPYVYNIPGEAAILRAPIGLYLLPALAGGGVHEVAMLLSNSLRMTLLLALCWPLFNRNRDRAIALAVFLLFSGLDILGTMVFSQLGAGVSWDHLERWNFNNQFSAHITQAFWVPQHALAGWACAFTFLLWQRGLAKIGLFAATIPLVAIWSPLAIMGAIPFALAAGIMTLRRGTWSGRDVLVAALALAVSTPALAYLQADAQKLGSGLRAIGGLSYLFLALFEIFPLILVPLLARITAVADRMTLWLILACLLLMPLYQIGSNTDFQMRASIMPLALLALLFAAWLGTVIDRLPSSRAAVIGAVAVLAVGAITPMFELRRAVALAPSPKPRCSLAGVWNQQNGLTVAPYATYFASSETFGKIVGPVPVLAGLHDPAKCWDTPWVAPDPER
jgi:hypothetical protein